MILRATPSGPAGAPERLAASRSRRTATFAGWPPGRRARLPLLTVPQPSHASDGSVRVKPHAAANARIEAVTTLDMHAARMAFPDECLHLASPWKSGNSGHTATAGSPFRRFAIG